METKTNARRGAGEGAAGPSWANVGARIRRRRKAAGMKQATLAQEAGVSAAQICHIEKDRVRPSLRTLEKIALALCAPLSELLDSTAEQGAGPGPREGGAGSGMQGSGVAFPGDALSSDALAGGGLGVWGGISDDARFETEGARLAWEDGNRSTGDDRRIRGDGNLAMGDGSRISGDGKRARGGESSKTGVARTRWAKDPVTGLLCVHDPRDAAVDRRVRGRLAKEIAAWKKTESEAGVDRRLSMPLFFPAAAAFGALLAKTTRTASGIGPAAIVDLRAFAEDRGLRVLETKLPADLDGWSVWDPADGNAFVFLRAAATAERKRFRFAYELGHLARFVSGGFRPLRDIGASKKISRAFAASALLPEEAVREAAHSLGLGSGKWTWELLLLQKRRFGVSAETYLYRVEELGLLASRERKSFLAKLKSHYADCRAAGRTDFEPTPPRNASGRLASLKVLARREGERSKKR